MEKDFNSDKSIRKKIVLYFLILLVSVLVLIFSFYLFGSVNRGSYHNSLSSDDIVFSYVEGNNLNKGIMITNAFSISDEEGKHFSQEKQMFNFVVLFGKNSLGCTYEVIGVKEDNSTLDDNAVKIYLTSRFDLLSEEVAISSTIDSNNVVKTYDMFKSVKRGDKTGKLLFSEVVSNSLVKEGKKFFTMRMWISQSYTTTLVKDETFSMKLDFYATE